MYECDITITRVTNVRPTKRRDRNGALASHTKPREEMPREIGILRKQRGRRLASEALEVADEMSLVVIAASKRRLHPTRRIIPDHPKYLHKSLQAAERSRSEPDRCAESPLKLAITQIEIGR